jgi:photosynthetic reaction center cytochrome c subunit
MKVWSSMIVRVAAPAAVLTAGLLFVAPRAGSQEKPLMSDQAFKNVQVLKGIPLDDFMGTMGVMSASLGYDCSECHTGAGTDKVDWAADTRPKVIARRMVTMVAKINHDNFSDRQLVTCWSCHHGRDRPATTPQLEAVYGPGSSEMDDALVQMPGQPAADEIIGKYLQAIGGDQSLAALKSIVETGDSVGFGGFGGGGHVHIYAKYPDQRATVITFDAATGRGDETRTFNGQVGWWMTPLAVLTDYQLSGEELDGAKLDAQLSFPGQIKQVLTNFRVSLPTTISDLPGPSSQTSKESEGGGVGKDRAVNVVQGTGPRGTLATLYFDQATGLLVRLVRYGKTQIGRVPTQVDYSDYRDVGGIKMPYRMTFAWLDGRDAIQIKDIQLNVSIDEAKFGRPVQSRKP